ncbi:MAG TPA: urease accessory protein UreD [Bauldia sp.]|nr:urease accessory protein UreD [Bauldia sp.]
MMLAALSADPARPKQMAATPALQRARGVARIEVRAAAGRSRLAALHQAGSSRIRLPRVSADAPLEAVLLNTAGGMTGGDHFEIDVAVGRSAAAVVTSQAAERVYRRSQGTARVETRLSVSGGGRLFWLPQETIIFNRSAMARTLTAVVEEDATLLAFEAVVLGRTAMGERLTDVVMSDAWRIRRGSRLVFADTTRLEGDAASMMNGRATGGGAIAFATLVLVAPDAEARVDVLRAALDDMPGEAGVSGFDGLLVARMIAGSGQVLRALAIRAVTTLRGVPMPRVWNL